MNKQEQLRVALESLTEAVPDIDAALLASRDGLVIGSTSGADGSRAAAMAATVLALGDRVVKMLCLGRFEESVIESPAGTFVVYAAGDLAVLAVAARGGSNLGLLHLESRRTADTLGRLLSSYYAEAAAEAAVVEDTVPLAVSGNGDGAYPPAYQVASA